MMETERIGVMQMIRLGILSSVVAAVVCLNSVTYASPGSPGEEVGAAEVIVLDGDSLRALLIATRDFQRSQKIIDCFKVTIELENGGVHVAFIPTQKDNETLHLGGSNSCGAGVSYFIKGGQVKRKWYAR